MAFVLLGEERDQGVYPRLHIGWAEGFTFWLTIAFSIVEFKRTRF